MKENNENMSILIVDDMPQNLDVARDLLENEGYRVLIATNGEKALLRAETILPDLILLDIQMPGMDGFETCRRLKDDDLTKDIPIIFLTAQADNDSVVNGFDLGAVDFVTKPFNAKELLSRVKTHLTLSSLQKKLIYANASKDKFFSIIGHDLKNPFNSILGLLEIVIEDFDEMSKEEIIHLVTETRSSAQKAYKLLENLLHWSRSQMGVMKVSKEIININKIIDDVLGVLNAQASKKNITLEKILEPDIEAFADFSMVDTVLRNLVSNAIKYTNENGSIKITAFNNNEEIIFSIVDNGIGISEEYKEKLFSITENSSTPGTAQESGTGLGLILCNEFVRKNGGKIIVSDNPEGGSIFSFTLPNKTE